MPSPPADPTQPLPFDFTVLERFIAVTDAACVALSRPTGCLKLFLKPYLAHEPDWVSQGLVQKNNTPYLARNALGHDVVVLPKAWQSNPSDQVTPNISQPLSTSEEWLGFITQDTAAIDGWLGRIDPLAERVRIMHFIGTPSLFGTPNLCFGASVVAGL
jgi:hypothetical protein